MERDHATAEVVLREERARVETRKVPVERVRVRKRVVMQTRTVTVEERREELSIERVPLAGEGQPSDAGSAAGDELVIVLREEVAEVVTKIVPVERVRIRRESVTETVAVDTELRREQTQVSTEPRHP